MKPSFLAATTLALALTTSVAFADQPADPPADAAAEPTEAKVEAEVLAPIAEPAPEIPQAAPVEIEIEKRANAEDAKLKKSVRSLPLTIVGSILTGTGSIALVTGIATFVAADGGHCDGSYTFGCGMSAGLSRILSFAAMISGGAQIAAGVPMLAVGARPPKTDDQNAPPAPKMGVQLGATGASFNLQF